MTENNENFDLKFVENKNVEKGIEKKKFPLLILDTYDVMGGNNYANLNNVTIEDYDKFVEDYKTNKERIKKLKTLLEESKNFLNLKGNGSNIIIGVDPYSTEELGQEVFSKYNIRRILYNTIVSKAHLDLDLKMYKNIEKLYSLSEDELKELSEFSAEDYRDGFKEKVKHIGSREEKIELVKKYKKLKQISLASKYVKENNIDKDFIDNLKNNYVTNNFWFLWGASAGKWYFKVDKENENFFNGKILSITKDGKVSDNSRKDLALSILKHYVKEGDTVLIVNNQEGSIIKDVALEFGCHVALLNSKEGVI